MTVHSLKPYMKGKAYTHDITSKCPLTFQKTKINIYSCQHNTYIPNQIRGRRSKEILTNMNTTAIKARTMTQRRLSRRPIAIANMNPKALAANPSLAKIELAVWFV